MSSSIEPCADWGLCWCVGNPAEFHTYNLGYDIVGHAVRVLRETQPEFSLPKNFFLFPDRGGYVDASNT